MRHWDRWIAALVLAATLASCTPAVQIRPGAGEASYVNPVLDRDFPDPSVLRTADGSFYVYATQSAASGRMLNVQVARSGNLVDWEHLGDALPAKPPWAERKQNFWAPHVIHDASLGKFFMYYSAEPDTANGKCLAVATADQPAGPFVDSGRPLVCGEGIEHIDPMAFDDPQTGKRLLYWGSGGRPIRVQELAADRLSFAAGSAPAVVLPADEHKPYQSIVEGVWVHYRNGTYFLFFSGDRCCSREPRYAVMVAKASDALGPFERFGADTGGSLILDRNGTWLAPGHNSVVADDAGEDWIIYHAIDAKRHSGGNLRQHGVVRVMLMDRIVYRDGWPRVEGNQPSVGAQPAPVVRPRVSRQAGPETHRRSTGQPVIGRPQPAKRVVQQGRSHAQRRDQRGQLAVEKDAENECVYPRSPVIEATSG